MIRQILTIVLVLVSGYCFAMDATAPEELKTKIQTVYPEMEVDAIKDSPISGLYQVTSGPVVLYASVDGRYLVYGEVLDLKKPEENRNITETTRKELRRSLLKQLKAKDMIVFKPKGAAKGVVTVFTDSECGYCHKLHQEVPKLTELGIEVRYLAFPRHGVESNTYTEMVAAWCSSNRQEAIGRAMKGEKLEAKTCTNPVADQFLLGRKFGVSGTPTLVYTDGTLWGGYLSAEKLAKDAIKHHSAASDSE